MSNHDEMKALIEKISGRASVIAVLRIYVDICGDLETAAVLSQCVFWSDKGGHSDGWFYKSRDEWHTEIGIKRGALEGAVKRLKELYLVETCVMSANHNSPTTFYRVNMDNLTQLVISYLKNRLAEFNQSNVRSVENSQSDWLKTANPSAENSQSSYSRLQQNISTDASKDKEKPKNTYSKRIEPDETVTDRHVMIWNQIVGEIQTQVRPATYQHYVSSSRPVSINGSWRIAVPDVGWWQSKMLPDLKRITKGMMNKDFEFEFVQDVQP